MTWKLMNWAKIVCNSRFPLNNYSYLKSKYKEVWKILSQAVNLLFYGIYFRPLSYCIAYRESFCIAF